MNWIGEFFGALPDAFVALWQFGGGWAGVLLSGASIALTAGFCFLAYRLRETQGWLAALFGSMAVLLGLWWLIGIVPSAWVYFIDTQKDLLAEFEDPRGDPAGVAELRPEVPVVPLERVRRVQPFLGARQQRRNAERNQCERPPPWREGTPPPIDEAREPQRGDHPRLPRGEDSPPEQHHFPATDVTARKGDVAPRHDGPAHEDVAARDFRVLDHHYRVTPPRDDRPGGQGHRPPRPDGFAREDAGREIVTA